MYEQVKNTKENKRLSPPNKISRKQSGSKSTFQFVDNRPEAIAQRKLQEMANNSPEAKQSAQLKSEPIKVHGSNQRVIQRFDAGIGAGWHVHFGSHLKYNGNNATRVNFPGRSRRQIGYAWEQNIIAQGLGGTRGTADFLAVAAWLRANTV